MGGFSSAPQVRANFLTEKGNIAASAKILDTREKDQIISVVTNKDLGQPAGSFTITLTGETVGGVRAVTTGTRVPFNGPEVTTEIRLQNNSGWKDWLKPGDIVVIEMGPDRPQPTDTYYAKNFTQGLSGTTEIVMVGTIDDVTANMSIGSDGNPHRTVTVSGRDFARYLIDDMVDRNPSFDPAGAYLGFNKNRRVEFPNVSVGGTPANVIQTVLRDWIFSSFDVEFDSSERGSISKKGQLKLSQILRYVLDNATPVIEFFQSWVFAEGAPWSIFQQVQSPPWYLMHLDVRRQKDIEAIMGYQTNRVDNNPPVVWNTDLSKFDSQVALLYYRNPHSNRYYDDWTKLPTRVITADDVVEIDLAVSVEEVFNRWVVTPEMVGFNRLIKLKHNALSEPDLEHRFGIRPRVLKTPFISGSRSDGDVNELVKRYTRLIRDWDFHNLEHLSGSMTIKGVAQVKVGDRLHYLPPGDRRGVDFYVEAVRQEFVALHGWKTFLQVTRGQKHRDVGEKLYDNNGKALSIPSAMGTVIS